MKLSFIKKIVIKSDSWRPMFSKCDPLFIVESPAGISAPEIPNKCWWGTTTLHFIFSPYSPLVSLSFLTIAFLLEGMGGLGHTHLVMLRAYSGTVLRDHSW